MIYNPLYKAERSDLVLFMKSVEPWFLTNPWKSKFTPNRLVAKMNIRPIDWSWLCSPESDSELQLEWDLWWFITQVTIKMKSISDEMKSLKTLPELHLNFPHNRC